MMALFQKLIRVPSMLEPARAELRELDVIREVNDSSRLDVANIAPGSFHEPQIP